jgi:hypothetical protein
MIWNVHFQFNSTYLGSGKLSGGGEGQAKELLAEDFNHFFKLPHCLLIWFGEKERNE